MSDHSHIEIAYSSIRVFADDGTLDMKELEFLLGLALRDDSIDDDEKRVLASIFDKATAAGVTEDVASRIQQVRERYRF
ncbi:MAG: hypothetical protein AAGN66_22135 [Acidobacteriota bacterium]